MPNLRCDNKFVEKPHIGNRKDYTTYVRKCKKKRTVFLELGVGFNTPGITRHPFEEMVVQYPKSTLVRANIVNAAIGPQLQDRSVELGYDLGRIMADISSCIQFKA